MNSSRLISRSILRHRQHLVRKWRNANGRQVVACSGVRVLSTTAQHDHAYWNNDAAATLAAGVLILSSAALLSERVECDSFFAPGPAAEQTKVVNQKPRNVLLQRRRSMRAQTLDEKYNVEWKTCLGEGAYGAVHPARVAATGEKVALKKLSKKYTNSSAFKTETEALLRIYDNGGHPNISGLRDIFEDDDHFYLILDLVKGGEMFEHLINYGAYSEADAARLMHEIASALAFLHGIGVVHADLKPENLLLCSKNRRDGTIKMIDFGCAMLANEDGGTGGKNIAPPDPPSTGTVAYWPPERLEDKAAVDAAMDMWSVGVILYIMLIGVHPFDLENNATDEVVQERIRTNPKPPLTKDLVAGVSDSAIDLISKLMEKDPKKRLSAYQMLQHPWVRGETAKTEKILDSDKKLSQFKDLRSKLEAGVFAILVSNGHRDMSLSEARVSRKKSGQRWQEFSSSSLMKRAFEVFDAEGKGFITPDDLGRVVSERTGSKLSSLDTQEFLESHNTGEDASAAALSLSAFSRLFSGLHHRHFPRGHTIFHANEKGDSMYFLSSGKVGIHTRKGQLVSILRSGDFFGEGSLVEEKNRRFTTAKCLTPVDVIEIKREDFDRYITSAVATKQELKRKWRARNLEYAKNLIRLQTNVKVRTLKKGEVVYREGDLGTSMFRVDDDDGGELEVSHGKAVVHKYVAGDSFGESSLLFKRPRSSTVTCVSDTCRVHEMVGEDFLSLVDSFPEMAESLRNMCRKRLFKKAVKAYSLAKNRGLSDADLVAAFHDADVNGSDSLSLEEVRLLMHTMDPEFPMKDIQALFHFVDVDEDGVVKLEEFKSLFRQFERETADDWLRQPQKE